MPRFLALTCLMLLSAVIARAGGLFDAGAWAPIVIPVEPEIDELHAARTLADWCERVSGVRRVSAEILRLPKRENCNIYRCRRELGDGRSFRFGEAV